MRQLPFNGRFRVTMAAGHAFASEYVIEPHGEEISAAYGRCILAAWEKPDGTMDPEGLFRCDLIESMQPELGGAV